MRYGCQPFNKASQQLRLLGPPVAAIEMQQLWLEIVMLACQLTTGRNNKTVVVKGLNICQGTNCTGAYCVQQDEQDQALVMLSQPKQLPQRHKLMPVIFRCVATKMPGILLHVCRSVWACLG